MSTSPGSGYVPLFGTPAAMDDDAVMPSPAATPKPWLWKMLLFGASLAALGVSTLAYLDDETSLLPVRLMMVVLMPVLMVGGGFRAGQMRQAASRE